MFGQNQILGAEFGDGTSLKIVRIFPTIQGEGPYAGWPSVFIRLGGCNLACEFCDTEFDLYEDKKVEDIISEIKSYNKKLVVITGGEPFRQPIELLVTELVEQGYVVQIESNGTLYRKIHQDAKIVCSPKNSGNGYGKIRTDLLQNTIAIKFLVSASDVKYNFIPEVGQSEFSIPVYVQPIDEYDEIKNQKNLNLALKLANENGYILSLQLHKILGID